MPKNIESDAVITILVVVKNDDGSSFTYSRTGTAGWFASTISERRKALRDAVMGQAEQFLDLSPSAVSND
jgi:hypothetical protein